METRQEWGARVAASVGGQVAHYRTRRRVEQGDDGPVLTEPLTLQQLSDRCRALGYPIARSVLSKLEKGHRQTITVDEVLVLAQALGVPPVVLLFPLGRAGTVEVLPGQDVDPWTATMWFMGNSDDPADLAALPQMGTFSPVMLWSEHWRWDGEIPVIHRFLSDPASPGDGQRERDRLELAAAALRRIREVIRGTGLTPPPLHPETARILGEEA
jgi:transcriptional regulator with XRE-family HTH domain